MHLVMRGRANHHLNHHLNHGANRVVNHLALFGWFEAAE